MRIPQQHRPGSKLTGLLGLAILAMLALLPTLSLAATNTGTADVNGTGLTDATFDLTGTQLVLVKNAFLASDDSQLTSGGTVPKGTEVKFMLYINNSTGAEATDVTIQDDLLADFTYTTTSMKASALAGSAATWCPGGVCDEVAIFGEVDTNGTALGDLDTDSDVGSWDGTGTVLDFGDGNNNNNAQLDIAADNVWAVVFTVTVN